MRKVSREMPAEWALEVMRKAPYITVSFIRKDGSAYGLPLSLASAEDGRVRGYRSASSGMPFGRKQMLPDGRSQGRLIHASIPLGSGIRPR